MPTIINYCDIIETDLSSITEYRREQIIDSLADLTDTHITIAITISAFSVGQPGTKWPQKLQPSTYIQFKMIRPSHTSEAMEEKLSLL